jgi:hypothetical protein
MKKNQEVIKTIFDIPKNTKLLFKAWCAKRNLAMKDVVVEMMKEKIKNG